MTLVGTGLDAPAGAATRPPGVLTRGWAQAAQPIEAVAGQWQSLAERVVADNPFFDPAFLGPAASALGADIEFLTVNDGTGRLLAMMPVTFGRLGRIAPALEVWTHEYGPLGTPVVDAARAREATTALVEIALERAGRSTALVLRYLVETDSVTQALEAAAIAAGRQVTRIDSHQRAALGRADGTDPRLQLPAKRRKEYARQIRRLADHGAVAFEHAVAPADIAKRFEDFLALEAAGWKGRRESAMAADPRIAGFARDAIADMARHGAASILTLRAGDRPAAILICLHENRTALTWKIAYDEALARYSPGVQLMLEAPRFLFANERIARIDSCAAPNHPMIDHIWPGRLPLATLVVGPKRMRWRGRAGLAAHHAETRLRNLARRTRQAVRPQTR